MADDENEIVGPYGPIDKPVERFAHLKKPVREWLEDLNEEDVDEIKEALRFYREARVVGRFSRWAFAVFVAAIGTMLLFGSQLLNIWKNKP